MENNPQVWYAVRTFNAQELKVSRYLERESVPHFVPMTVDSTMEDNGQTERKYRPFVHNLIFMRKTMRQEELTGIMQKCPYPVKVYCHEGTSEYYEISDEEMSELRAICDFSLEGAEVIPIRNANLNVGQMVKVMHGPLRGVQGCLVRKKKKYYIVKTIADMGLMVTVSRWCCKAIG